MNAIEVRGEIIAPPHAVWSFLGDFGGVASWNPFVERAEIVGDGVGMTRTITANGGARIVERLETVEPDDHHLRYSVTLESGAQSTADVRLEAGANGGTLVVWQSIREHQLSREQEDVIAATLRSRIDALAEAVAGD